MPHLPTEVAEAEGNKATLQSVQQVVGHIVHLDEEAAAETTWWPVHGQAEMQPEQWHQHQRRPHRFPKNKKFET